MKAERPRAAQVVLDEGAVVARPVVELVDEDDVRVHRADDRRDLRDLRVRPVPERRGKLPLRSPVHRRVEGGEADDLRSRRGAGHGDRNGEGDGNRRAFGAWYLPWEPQPRPRQTSTRAPGSTNPFVLFTHIGVYG